ncbi:MAG: hypothetical protein ACYCZR_11175, partial [Burkholderiales bacterium]
ASSVGGTGMATANMQTQANFTGWDFTTPVWAFKSGINNNYPILCIFSTCTAASSGSSSSSSSGSSSSSDAQEVITQLESLIGGQLSGGQEGGNAPSSGAGQGATGPSGTITEVSGGAPQNGAPPNMNRNVVFTLGSTGSLRIVNGGVHLPDDVVSLTGGQDTEINPNRDPR